MIIRGKNAEPLAAERLRTRLVESSRKAILGTLKNRLVGDYNRNCHNCEHDTKKSEAANKLSNKVVISCDYVVVNNCSI